MHTIRLSVIIPFYNVEQYIAQCLASVYDQDIPEEEYEVICVDDCSPDGSRVIVEQYADKHAKEWRASKYKEKYEKYLKGFIGAYGERKVW